VGHGSFQSGAVQGGGFQRGGPQGGGPHGGFEGGFAAGGFAAAGYEGFDGPAEEAYAYPYDQLPPPRDLRVLGLAAVVAAGLFTVVRALATLVGLTSAEAPDAAETGGTDPMTVASLASGVLLGLVLLMWIYRARKNIDAFADAQPRWSLGWTVGAVFIPCANVVLVPVVLADVARASVVNPESGRARRLVALIWACLALTVVASFSSGLVSGFVETSGPSVSTVVAGLLLGVIAGVMLIVVIHTITAEQQARITGANGSGQVRT
jgi:hypothetical protein